MGNIITDIKEGHMEVLGIKDRYKNPIRYQTP